MVWRFLIMTVLLALVGGGLVGFNIMRDRMIADFFANRPEQALPVETIEASATNWRPAIAAIGTVNAVQGVDLTVEAAGIVREIGFSANQRVSEGDLVLRLDDSVQGADLEAARTQFSFQEASLQRQRELQTRGVTTSVSLENSEASFRAAEAQVARAEAVLAQRYVNAPFSGVIGLPRVDRGQFVSAGTVIATLQDRDTMRVDFSLPEQNLPDITIGQRLELRIDGLDRDFAGNIVGIDPRVDPNSRMVALRGTVDNPDGALTPGQFVRIRIDLPEEGGVIALPQTTVMSSLYGDFVYAVRPREDGEQLEVRQLFVTPGRRSDGMIEIVGGLEAGERLVSSGQNRLANRALVTISEDPAPNAEEAAAAGQ